MKAVKIDAMTITEDRLIAAAKVLYDNGIEGDECGVVLQALGYVLLDTEFDCDDIEIEEEDDEDEEEDY